MCGICGYFGPNMGSAGDPRETAQRMARTLAHRGPDDSDTWVDTAAGIALAHRRLSIIDLSPLGRQPMTSPSGRYVGVLNGEIYNYRELRRELERSTQFRGASDTEVLLAAVDAWGIPEAARRSRGMFAIALWDRVDGILHLVRDRIGEKPLYYGWQGASFLFASELKALREHPAFRGEIDRDALAQFFRFNYVPGPGSIYRGIRKLLPGMILSIDPRQTGADAQPVAYWTHHETVGVGANARLGDEERAAELLETVLRDAVREQMIADVPLGALLSGGIDSSLVVALMQAQSSRPVRTFTIGFQEAGFDEAKFAARVARHLGTDHTELYVTPSEAMDVIPQLPRLYDEPFADSSQIPTYLVSRMARRHVTVALSGDGGDELFGGYNRYVRAPQLWRQVSWIPPRFRMAAASAIRSVSSNQWRSVGRAASRFARGSSLERLGEKAVKAAAVLASREPNVVYQSLVAAWHNAGELVIGGSPGTTLVDRPSDWPQATSFEEQMMYVDAMTYLPDDILVKVDRAAMAVSLETRAPYLDSRVIEFASTLPLEMKIRGGVGKHILRRVLYKHVPREMIDRPKMGFGVPVGDWIRGPLRDWAESLLDAKVVREAGFLNADLVRSVWESHVKGRSDETYRVWAVLMFQAWLADEQPAR